MPMPEYYAISEPRLLQTVQQLRALATQQDLTQWRQFYRNLDRLYPSPLLSSPEIIFVHEHPLTRMRWHRGYDDCSLDRAPEVDSPLFQQLLCELTLSTAQPAIRGRFDKFWAWFTFNITKTNGLLRTAAEEREHQLLMYFIFGTRDTIPPYFSFLRCSDAQNAYVSVEQIEEILHIEAKVGLLQNLPRRIGIADPIWSSFGREIKKLHHFLHILMADGQCLYYREYST